ncbi:MAG: sigma-70 family RNA polymerase sigma factor [Bryobacteraceae bacterium]|nr:sigma-70 family RNA polymerase sigma factor [Bryobacteraceae bacterium]
MKNSETLRVFEVERETLTQLLEECRVGKSGSLDQAFHLVYNELRRLARRQLSQERGGHTLAATGLVHEAYLKLLGSPVGEWHGRAHFFAVAARAMRQILIEHARRRGAQKRGADPSRTSLDDRLPATVGDVEEMLALDAALDRLGAIDPRARTVVEYRFFCGLSEAETAELLGVTSRTVERVWVKARAWLYKELYSRPLPRPVH